ncbi:MAG TPA: ABC transporter substrate-binding protein [Chloroflexota bacterium]
MSEQFPLRYVLALISLVALIGCQAPPGSTQSSTAAEAPRVAKHATAAIMGDPPHFEGRFNPSIGSVPGLDVIEEMLNAGTANFTDQGQLRPQLAEAVPSIDNGLWKVFPDGRMETTWHLRSGVAWHDGRPLTSDDLLFTAGTGTDKDIPGFADAIYESVESISAPDPLTLVATWKGPFIGADTLFTRLHGLPLPKHILEQPHRQDKAAFANLPYWSDQFIGTGAYKLRELVRGSHVILDANDQFVLGRPKIDVWEIKFTPDANTMITELLSGDANLTLGARISIDQAYQVEQTWHDGTVLYSAQQWVAAMPQFIDPTPTSLLDVRMRRALQYAVNRQAIADDLLYGKVPIDDAPILPSDADYKDVEAAIVRYPYDPQMAARLFSELGFQRTGDGPLLDSTGQRLTIESRTNNQLDTQVKATAIMDDNWRRAGVDVSEVVYGQQAVADREYRHTRPAFETIGFPIYPETFALYTTQQIPRPETGWFGQNRTRYSNREYDSLVDLYFKTVPRPARMDIERQIVRAFTDQLVVLPLVYNTTHVAVGRQFSNVTNRGPNGTEGWNAEQWNVSS